MLHSRARLRLAAAATLLVAGACPAPRPTRISAGRANVVLVLVDTLRADRTSLYGYRRPTTPALERFARERAVVFRKAWANAGCTFPSANSLLTGRWPQRFFEHVRVRGIGIPVEYPSLAERFLRSGYSTAAVSASLVVRATPSKVNPRGGFERGFQRFDETCAMRPAACVNQHALAELDRLEEPFFLYLHYLDPHAPYRPPRGSPRAFTAGSTEPPSPWARQGLPWPIEGRLYRGETATEIRAADVRRLSDLYDEEVRYFDSRIGRWLDELGRRGLLERTLVAVVADHGEELYDHQEWGHCRSAAYDTIVATPFLLAVPGLAPGERRTPVSNLDLAPTLLDLAQVAVAPGELDGESLRPLLEHGDAGRERIVFAASGTIRTATDGRLAVRLDLGTGKSDVSARPGAEGLDAGERAASVRALARSLRLWIQKEEGTATADSVERAQELERQLTAVGYL